MYSYNDYNKIYKLCDWHEEDKDQDFIFWKGTPTPLGELFCKKVEEHTFFRILGCYINVLPTNIAFCALQIYSDEYRSEARTHRIATYSESSLYEPIGDISSVILNAFKESVEELKLPMSDEFYRSLQDISIQIFNTNQNVVKEKSRDISLGYIERRRKRYRLSSLNDWSSNFIDRSDIKINSTELGRRFNQKLNARTGMNIILSSFLGWSDDSINVQLYDSSAEYRSAVFSEASCTKTISPLCAQIYGCLRESVEEMKLPPLTSSPEKCHLTVRILSYRKELMRRFIFKNIFLLDEKMRNAFPDTSITVREITLPSYDCNVHLKDRAELEFVESKYGKDAVFNAFCKALRECDESEILENDLPKIRIALRSELGPEARDIIGESVFKKL